MAKVERWIGGPGTGKTRLIQERLTDAKEELRLSTDEIGLCTFTRAGRHELSERVASAWGCEPEALTKHGWFRTAHSIAYRQAGIEDGRLLEGQDGREWIGQAIGQKVAVTRTASGEPDYCPIGGGTTADLSLKAWELARQTLGTLSGVIQAWSAIGDDAPSLSEAKSIVSRYELAKTREGRVDFTDIVSLYAGVKHTIDGHVEVEPIGDVPESLRVLAIDEAQDSSAVVDRICRRLASSPHMERVFIVGDPYQSIYGFGGSDYRHFLSWDADEKTMPRSYRCPQVVMGLGERCIRQMRSGYRDRGIIPATHQGRVSHASDAREAVRGIRHGESTLILGRCGFSLSDYEHELQSAKIPYSWVDAASPLAALSGYRCLWDLEHGRVVHGEDWANAISMLAARHVNHGKLLVHGEKAAWRDGRRSEVDFIRPTSEDLSSLAGCEPALISLILAGEWVSVIDAKHSHKAEAWRQCAAVHGPELASNPMVRLSTIHSAKGLEGDTVIMSTVSSRSVEAARQSLASRWDEECRVNYVGVTRARQNLVVVDDGQNYRLELPI